MTESKLHDLYGRWLGAHAPPDRSACIAPEMLREVAEGRATEPERIAALRHVAGCPACLRDLELLRAVISTGHHLRRRRAVTLALAASIGVLLAGAAVWSLALAPGTRRDVMRGAPESLVLLEPMGAVPAREQVVLAWRPVAGALQYEVQVVDAEGTSILSATTSDSSVRVVADTLFRPGVEYRWWVQAELRDGTRPRSDARRFHLETR